jgi:predicted metal-dependent peptidase
MLLTPIEEKLTVARIGLMLRASFFGNLASRMKLVESSSWCDTAATNGRDFYYNSEFVEKLSVKQLEFLFGHEILHICFEHFLRRGSRDVRLSNIAQDFAINILLVDEKIGTVIDQVPLCLDPVYRGKSWEEIYELLIENATVVSLDDILAGMDSLDDHLSQDDSGDGDGDEDGKEGSGRPKFSKAEWQEIRDSLKEAMVQAHAAAAGNVPAAIKRLIQDMTEPKMNWRELLQMNIQSIVRSNYSFSRPSRKGWASGAILPGMIPEQTIDIAIALDMSGSIGQNEISIFLGEISGIMSQYTDYKIDLFCYDTQVYNSIVITADNAGDLLTYEPVGGGGTDYTCILEHLKENNLSPKKLVNFTDGYVSDYVSELGELFSVLTIIFGNEGCTIPYGETVHYTD